MATWRQFVNRVFPANSRRFSGESKVLSLRLPTELTRLLSLIAVERELTQSTLARGLLEELVEEYEKYDDDKSGVEATICDILAGRAFNVWIYLYERRVKEHRWGWRSSEQVKEQFYYYLHHLDHALKRRHLDEDDVNYITLTVEDLWRKTP